MEKNTILAVILSSVVVVASVMLQSHFMEKNRAETETAREATEAFSGESIKNDGDEEIKFSPQNEADEEKNEQFISVSTNVADIRLTNRGGDIVSFKLKKHIDIETREGVEMVQNVSADNRALSLSSGGASSSVINDFFTTEKISDKKILFTKRFNAGGNDFVLGKLYTFTDDEYMFRVEILFHSNDGDISLSSLNGAYSIRTSPQIGPAYNPKLNKYEIRQFISKEPGGKVKKQNVGANQFKEFQKNYVWDGIVGKYFAALVIPEEADKMLYTYFSSEKNGENINSQAILVRKPFKGTDIKDSYYFYFGPRNEKELSRYNSAENNEWKLSDKRLTDSLQSSGFLSPLEAILKWCLEKIYLIVPNWGASIIVMTLLLRLALFPVTKNQSMSSLKMQELSPEVKRIQEKYKNDPQKQQMALAALYKEKGYNPMSGCLPMIVQFLIIFAMYNLFNNYFEFRGASFIPGWIDDLSTGDKLYTFKFSVPLLGDTLRILPIIYLLSQLVFSKITRMGTPASGSQTQMNMMMYGMPVMFFFFFYNAPAGLLIYWTVSNIFQLGQQLVINKMMKNGSVDNSKKLDKNQRSKR